MHVQAHAFDFIEEQCAAIGKLKLADTTLLRTGKRPGFMAEQLAFNHRLRQCAGVDCHKRSIAPARQIMQCPCDHFFARTGFAQNQYIGFGRGQCADLLAQAQHGR